MSTTPPFPTEAQLTQAPFSTSTRTGGSYSRRPYDILGLAWLHGSLHASIFRRQVLQRSWESPAPVRTVEEFEAALDAALVQLRFGGSEVFLILEHDSFVHQAEQAPAFSEAAARAYLRGRVERFEKEHEPVLWVSQRTVSARQESTFLLHLLPSAFYGKINGMLLSRRLDLTRILPLAVPLQLSLATLAPGKESAVLIAADTGDATTVMVARPSGDLLFARTMLARWDTDPARIGVEVNRSVLYAKQQFSSVIDTIWLLGSAGDAARAEVQTRCGANKEIIVRTTTPIEWLELVAKLTPRHPINLVAGYLGKKRRQQFIRRSVTAGCWLLFALLSLDTWTRVQTWMEENVHLHQLQKSQGTLRADRARLQIRNTEVQKERDFVREVYDERLPGVPARFFAYVSSAIPPEARLSDLNVKCDTTTGKWEFRFEGQIEGDEETCREALSALQKAMTRGPFRIHFNDSSRSITPVPSAGIEAQSTLRFALEGTLFEG